MAEHSEGIDSGGLAEAYQAPPSLWKLVEEHVPPEERLEIKGILGEALVDLSLELHTEVETLLDILREVRGRLLTLFEAQKQISHPMLADPPAVKEMLRQEIHLLLLDIRQKAREQGRDENNALLSYNPDVVSFAMGASRPGSRARQLGSRASRPGSALSVWDGQEVPFRPLTASSMEDNRPASSLSSSSSLGDSVEAIKDKLNVLDIDEVVTHLQSILQEECRMLEQDSHFLQTCLEEEHHYNAELETPYREPTVAEMKEERRTIERDLHLATPVPNSLIANKVAAAGSIKQVSRKGERNNRTEADISNSRSLIRGPVRASFQSKLEQMTPCPTLSDVKGSSLNRTRPKLSRTFSGSSEHSVLQTSDVSGYHGDGFPGRMLCHVSTPASGVINSSGAEQIHNRAEHLDLEKFVSGGTTLGSSEKRISHVGFLGEKTRTLSTQLGGAAPIFPMRFKLGMHPRGTLQATDAVLAPTPPSVERSAVKASSSTRRMRLVQQDKITS